jgi:hypothetical protein
MNENQAVVLEFLKPISSPNIEIAKKIIDMIISNYKDLDYAIKWKRLTFGINQDFHHWLFAIQPTKNSIGIVFHFGGLLEDKNQVFIKGESIFLRKLEFKSIENIDWQTIEYFIEQALSKLDYFKANWKELNKKQ